jgi:hypothetical protein
MVPMPLKTAAEVQGSPAAVWLSKSNCSGEYYVVPLMVLAMMNCNLRLTTPGRRGLRRHFDATDRIISPLDLKMITGRRTQAQRRLLPLQLPAGGPTPLTGTGKFEVVARVTPSRSHREHRGGNNRGWKGACAQQAMRIEPV